jgi:4-hydroxybenzoate polyprenyltransferase
MKLLYFYISVLSLDICLGALASLHFTSEILDTKLSLENQFLFFISVWSIYSLDHLRDSKSIEGKIVNPRHLFFFRYYSELEKITFFTILISISLAIYLLNLQLFFAGTGIGLLSVLHIFFSSKRITLYPKEISLALIYSLGVWTLPLFQTEFLGTKALFCFLGFFSINILNSLGNSLLDLEIDKKENQVFLLSLLSTKYFLFLYYFFFTFVAFSFLLGFVYDIILVQECILFLMIGCAQCLMVYFRKKFQSDFTHRMIGEGSYLLFFLI